ncbi:MAG: hypothetical protein U1C49_03000 [Candidatus Andersenbacteria bacterium]|nr:hypothetical protein [bacterium]MDZ4225795.1 hypothetical protein [Candidatus Andersenbacteria bacterium]
MGIFEAAWLGLACLMVQAPVAACLSVDAPAGPATEQIKTGGPEFTGEAVDVVLSAQAALVWDLTSGDILYQKNANTRRPIASLSKLLSALTIRRSLSLDDEVEISRSVLVAQRMGANISVPVGEHVRVDDLLAASMIASANDTIVALADAVAGSEDDFVQQANVLAPQLGANNTRLANATGLTGGEQYSTAFDVRRLLTLAYNDPVLGGYLARAGGTLTTREGTHRSYESTNKLLKTYVPILAAKTGYTVEAGENLAIITQGGSDQKIGAVILGSEDRFQDMKVLVEWIWRNYSWEKL